jgi:two-component system, NtrC family, sensor kinase
MQPAPGVHQRGGRLVSRNRWAWLKTGTGVAVAAIGLATLAGWLTDNRVLAGLARQFIPMAPNTAIGFLLLGVALLAMPNEGRARWRIATGGAAAAVVVLLASARLLEYTHLVEFDVDAWYWRGPGDRVGQAPTGKMALLTAITFELASVSAFLLAASGGRAVRDIGGALGSIVATSGATFALGYLYAAPLFYGGTSIPMALNTAIAFLILGIGLASAAGPAAIPLRPLVGPSVQARLLRAFVPFAIVIVLVSNWLTHAVTWLATPRAMAIASTVSIIIATVITTALCALFAGRIGGQLQRAEDELHRANELLETRVLDRTRELREAKALLEERNRQMQQSAVELERTAQSVRQAHQELQAAHEDLKRAEAQLVQSERLSSLGQVVAGVAHEINNPLAFVSNNVAVIERDVGQLHELIRLYQQAEGTLEQHQRELLARIHDLGEQMDLACVLEHVPELMRRSHEGLKRIQRIVKDLRDFARLDEAELKEADLNESVAPTLAILESHAISRGVSLVENLEPIPAITCFPAKINQVLLNLVTNAIDACDGGGTVTVSTGCGNLGGVDLAIADTGCGIDPSIRGRIFEPFFTTKPIGKGTGLGLAISYGIVASHGGTIEVESELGRGSRFTVHLPNKAVEQRRDARKGDRDDYRRQG